MIPAQLGHHDKTTAEPTCCARQENMLAGVKTHEAAVGARDKPLGSGVGRFVGTALRVPAAFRPFWMFMFLTHAPGGAPNIGSAP
jgi:hypothetical protein